MAQPQQKEASSGAELRLLERVLAAPHSLYNQSNSKVRGKGNFVFKNNYLSSFFGSWFVLWQSSKTQADNKNLGMHECIIISSTHYSYSQVVHACCLTLKTYSRPTTVFTSQAYANKNKLLPALDCNRYNSYCPPPNRE